MSKKFKAVSIRVPVHLHERVTAACRQQNRSFNDVAIQQLQAWVDRGDDEQEPGVEIPGTQVILTDFTALEERIMARFDKLDTEHMQRMTCRNYKHLETGEPK